MTIQDKKKQVLALLSNTNDSTLIEEVFDILQPDVSINEVDIEQLPNQLQLKIKRAFEDYKNGNYITHETIKEKIAVWLK